MTIRCIPVVMLLFVAGLAFADEPDEKSQTLDLPTWWLKQAVMQADQVQDENLRGDVSYSLVNPLAQKHQWDQALRLAALIRNPQTNVYAYTAIAKQARDAKSEDICRQALAAARATAIDSLNSSAITQAITQAFTLGYPEEARLIADGIPNNPVRDVAFQQLANELAIRGEVDEAFRIAETKFPASTRDIVSYRLASACATVLHVDDMEKCLKGVNDSRWRDNAFRNLSQHLLRAGRLDEARTQAQRIVDPVQRDRVLTEILQNSIPRQTAQELSREFAAATTRETKLAFGEKLFAQYINEEKTQEAEALIPKLVEVVRTTPRSPERSKFGSVDDDTVVLLLQSQALKIAAALKKQGHDDEGKRLLAQGRAAVEKMPDQSGIAKMTLTDTLVAIQIEFGDFHGLEKMLDSTDDDVFRSKFIAALAAHQIRSGHVVKGLLTAQEIRGKHVRGHDHGTVLIALIDAKMPERAIIYLRKIGNTFDESDAFGDIAQAMLERDRGAELYAWLAQIPNPATRAQLCLGAAQGLMQKDMSEK